MTSIFYKIFSKPLTLNDYLENLDKQKPDKVNLTLKHHQRYGEVFVTNQLIASFAFHYNGKTIHTDKVCAAELSHYHKMNEISKDIVDNANNSLDSWIKKLTSYSIPLEGAEKKFPYDLNSNSLIKEESWIF